MIRDNKVEIILSRILCISSIFIPSGIAGCDCWAHSSWCEEGIERVNIFLVYYTLEDKCYGENQQWNKIQEGIIILFIIN